MAASISEPIVVKSFKTPTLQRRFKAENRALIQHEHPSTVIPYANRQTKELTPCF